MSTREHIDHAKPHGRELPMVCAGMPVALESLTCGEDVLGRE